MDSESLWRFALKNKLPNWFPDSVIDAQIGRFSGEMTKADYENLDNLLSAQKEYLGTLPKNQREMAAWRMLEEPKTLDMLIRSKEQKKGTRFNQNTDAFWPSLASVEREYSHDGHLLGYVNRTNAPTTAKVLADPVRFPDVLPHELQHTVPNVYNTYTVMDKSLGQYTPLFPGLKGQKEADEEAMMVASMIQLFKDEGYFAENVMDNERELLANLVGREANIPEGKSVLDDEVLGVMLSDQFPNFRDWYFKNRFATGAFNKGTE